MKLVETDSQARKLWNFFKSKENKQMTEFIIDKVEFNRDVLATDTTLDTKQVVSMV